MGNNIQTFTKHKPSVETLIIAYKPSVETLIIADFENRH